MKTKVKHPWFRAFVRQYLLKVIFGLIVLELLLITFFQNRNHLPEVHDDESQVFQEYSVNVPVLQNDTDKDREQTLSIHDVTPPLHGKAEILSRVIRYTPDAEFEGEDQFSYRISDGKGVSKPAVVKIRVDANLKPTANADAVAIFPWTRSIRVNVLENDQDREKDAITLVEFSAPAHGSVELLPEGVLEYHASATPAEGDRFTYQISDGRRVSDPAEVEITVIAVDNPIFCEGTPYGDIREYEMHDLRRWEIREGGDGGDGVELVIGLNTTDYHNLSGNRLGEYCIVKDSSVAGDFVMKLRYRIVDDLPQNGNADCAVVFAFVDPEHYCYLSLSSGNEGSGATGLYKILNGVRQDVAFKGRAVLDNNWHRIELHRNGRQITVSQDDQLLVSGNDDAFAKTGVVGVGSYNDQAWFDDIELDQ